MAHAPVTIAATKKANGGGVACQFRKIPLSAANHVVAIQVAPKSRTVQPRRTAKRDSPSRRDSAASAAASHAMGNTGIRIKRVDDAVVGHCAFTCRRTFR
jgi:hypothetical protein